MRFHPLPNPNKLSNDEILETEFDRHAYDTSEQYREWFCRLMDEMARRHLDRPATASLIPPT